MLVWCHGGCFGSGSSSWDQPLRQQMASELGVRIEAVEFSLDNFEQALQDIEGAVRHHQAIGLVGVSSGGLLAHLVAERCRLPAFLVAPVLRPYQRHLSLHHQFQQLQLKSFGQLQHMENWENQVCKTPPNAPRIVVMGGLDTVRARVDSLVSWLHQGQNVTVYLTPQNHSEVCQTLPLSALLSWKALVTQTGSK